jgi:hypothetical protein
VAVGDGGVRALRGFGIFLLASLAIAGPVVAEQAIYVGTIKSAKFSNFETEGSERVIYRTKIEVLNPDKVNGIPKSTNWDIAAVSADDLLGDLVVFIGDQSAKFPEGYELLLPTQLYCSDTINEAGHPALRDYVVERDGNRINCVTLPPYLENAQKK